MAFLESEDGFRLSCSASEEDVSYKWLFRPTGAQCPYVQAPLAVVDTRSELIVTGDSTETDGYYFCVMKNSTSGDVAISQLLSVHSGTVHKFYVFLFY